MGAFCGFFTAGEKKKKIVGGFADDLFDRLRLRGGLSGKRVSRVNPRMATYQYHPEVFKWAADEALSDAGAEVLFHTVVVEVIRDHSGRRLSGVIVENKAGAVFGCDKCGSHLPVLIVKGKAFGTFRGVKLDSALPALIEEGQAGAAFVHPDLGATLPILIPQGDAGATVEQAKRGSRLLVLIVEVQGGAVFVCCKRGSNLPVFVHCQHGADRTGCMIGLYRVKVQSWKFEQAWLGGWRDDAHVAAAVHEAECGCSVA